MTTRELKNSFKAMLLILVSHITFISTDYSSSKTDKYMPNNQKYVSTDSDSDNDSVIEDAAHVGQ